MGKTNQTEYATRWMLRKDMDPVVSLIKNELISMTTEDGFERLMRSKNMVARVAADGDTPVAIAVYLLTKKVIRVLLLAVHPEHRQRGIGTMLLEEIEKRAMSVDTRESVVATVPEHLLPGGADFLRRLGYLGIGLEKATKPDEVDLVVMRKGLLRNDSL